MSKHEAFERLRAVPLFASCSSRQLRHIAGRGWEQQYPRGSVLCEQGKFGDEFFVILEGRAQVVRDGREARLPGPGDYNLIYEEDIAVNPPFGFAKYLPGSS